MGAPAANAILAACGKKVSPKLVSKIRFDTRPNAKYFRAVETRAARRHRDRYCPSRDRVRETSLGKGVATAADQIRVPTGIFAKDSRGWGR
jgi:hypothetical protein